uniref:Uncharacterized protein n=1 Tax=Ascaris lumbricoides TaxID=6252 RepID=A0A0M3I1F6_ASCLU
MLRRPGIGPGPPAWQASILPLNHRRWFRSEVVFPNGCEALKASVIVLRRPGIGPGPPSWQTTGQSTWFINRWIELHQNMKVDQSPSK